MLVGGLLVTVFGLATMRCQAMGRMPANKYEERNGPRTAELAAMLRRESARAEQDVRRFSDADAGFAAVALAGWHRVDVEDHAVVADLVGSGAQ